MINQDEIVAFMQKLRNQGCAVVVFLPEELAGLDPERLEDQMIEHGNDVIEMLGEEGLDNDE
jgi:hypothetical protein